MQVLKCVLKWVSVRKEEAVSKEEAEGSEQLNSSTGFKILAILLFQLSALKTCLPSVIKIVSKKLFFFLWKSHENCPKGGSFTLRPPGLWRLGVSPLNLVCAVLQFHHFVQAVLSMPPNLDIFWTKKFEILFQTPSPLNNILVDSVHFCTA